MLEQLMKVKSYIWELIRCYELCCENKMKIHLALRILWGLFCLLLLLLNVSDYIQFTKYPELYPIGAEGLGWTYKSYKNYTFTCLLTIFWDIVGLIVSTCYRFRYSGKILLIHSILTLILFIYYWICFYYGFYG